MANIKMWVLKFFFDIKLYLILNKQKFSSDFRPNHKILSGLELKTKKNH
jgi:hypothetical protein